MSNPQKPTDQPWQYDRIDVFNNNITININQNIEGQISINRSNAKIELLNKTITITVLNLKDSISLDWSNIKSTVSNNIITLAMLVSYSVALWSTLDFYFQTLHLKELAQALSVTDFAIKGLIVIGALIIVALIAKLINFIKQRKLPTNKKTTTEVQKNKLTPEIVGNIENLVGLIKARQNTEENIRKNQGIKDLITFLVEQLNSNKQAITEAQENKLGPHHYNPIRKALIYCRKAMFWAKRTAIDRPLLMAAFGVVYIFPATIMFMGYYGNPHFSAPINWLYQHVFLPVANGLVNASHAHWVAALATGFLFAKIFFLLADFIESAFKKGNIGESYLVSWLYDFFKRPFSNILILAGLTVLVQIGYGIDFLTHYSGTWVLFNLMTVLFKISLFLYDTINNSENSLIGLSLMFIPRVLADLNSFFTKLPQVVFGLIIELIVAPIRFILWPILRVYIETLTTPFMSTKYKIKVRDGFHSKNNNIIDYFERKTKDKFDAIKSKAQEISLVNLLLVFGSVYTIIPIVYMLFFNHMIVGPFYNWYNQLIMSAHVKFGIFTPCIISVLAVICPSILLLYNDQNNIRVKLVAVVGFAATVGSLITNSSSQITNEFILYFVLSASALSLLFYMSNAIICNCSNKAEPSRKFDRDSKVTATQQTTSCCPVFTLRRQI